MLSRSKHKILSDADWATVAVVGPFVGVGSNNNALSEVDEEGYVNPDAAGQDTFQSRSETSSQDSLIVVYDNDRDCRRVQY